MAELEPGDGDRGGRRASGRVRPRFIIALVLVVVGVAAALGVRALSSAHARSVRAAQLAGTQRAYATAVTALAARSLPAGVRPGPGGPAGCSGAALCGHSTLTPQQLAPELRTFVGPALRIHGRRPPLPGGCLQPAGARRPFCAEAATGRFHGYPIFAIAFWNVLEVKHGRAPAGARLYDRTRSERIYLRGSTVSIYLSAPAALAGD